MPFFLGYEVTASPLPTEPSCYHPRIARIPPATEPLAVCPTLACTSLALPASLQIIPVFLMKHGSQKVKNLAPLFLPCDPGVTPAYTSYVAPNTIALVFIRVCCLHLACTVWVSVIQLCKSQDGAHSSSATVQFCPKGSLSVEKIKAREYLIT